MLYRHVRTHPIYLLELQLHMLQFAHAHQTSHHASSNSACVWTTRVVILVKHFRLYITSCQIARRRWRCWILINNKADNIGMMQIWTEHSDSLFSIDLYTAYRILFIIAKQKHTLPSPNSYISKYWLLFQTRSHPINRWWYIEVIKRLKHILY